MERIAIVGGEAAGMSAAARAKRRDPNAEVVVFERSGFISVGACGMPYHLDGRIADPTTLLIRSPEEFRASGIDVRLHSEVVDLDLDRRRLSTRTGPAEADRESWEFDRLLIATGARAVMPNVDGLGGNNVFTFRTYDDMVALTRYLDEHHSASVTVVGGGYIGIELSEVLTSRGVEVTLLEAAHALLPRSLDIEMAHLVQAELESNGVIVRTGERLVAIGLQSGAARTVTSTSAEWQTDAVVMCTGITPANELAERAGIKLDEHGAVMTNPQLETSAAGVWAAGDCASTYSLVTGERVWIPLGPLANKQGRIAGSNMVGGNLSFAGVLGTSLVKAARLEVGRTGLTEVEAKDLGYEAVAVTVEAEDRAPYYPGGMPITVKLVAERESGRLLGGQLVGSGVPGRTNVIATALHGGFTAASMSMIDLGYAPPFAPVWDPVLIAAQRLADLVG